jgi:transcriptional regulator with XRE-family HTH domain
MRDQRARSSRYRDAQDRLRPVEEIARIVIHRRAELGLTQQMVAGRMGTTKSVISQIESGQHRSGLDMIRRLAEALDGCALLSFEFPAGDRSSSRVVRL